MAQIKSGDKVAIHYTGTLLDGTTFDSSEGREPLEFTVGTGQIIPGLDSALPGMAVGEKKVVKVPCLDAYGPIRPEMRQAILILGRWLRLKKAIGRRPWMLM